MNTKIVTLFVGLTCYFSGIHAEVSLSIHPRQVNEYSLQTLSCAYFGTSTISSLTWRKLNTFNEVGVVTISEKDRCHPLKLPDPALYSYNCSVETNIFTLNILNVTRANKGDIFVCIIHTANGDLTSNSVSSDIIVSITSVTMTQPMTDVVTAQVNTTAVFVCETSGGLPAARVTWFKDSGTPDNTADDIDIASSSSSARITSGNLITVTSRLIYSPIKLDRNMRIYCIANNSRSTILISYRKPLLNIQYPPESPPFIQQGTTFKIIENTQATLSCSVTGGNPLANLTWNCYNHYSIIAERTSGETVTKEVSWIASRGQDGSCTCVSTYYTSVQNVSIRIEILYSSSITMFTLNGVQESNTISENDPVVPVICDVDSNPGSVITIEHDGKILMTQNDSRHLAYSIAQAKCTDAGYYHCIAQNAYNIQPAIRVVRHFVKCSPRPSPFVPLIDRMRTVLHTSIALKFSALSFPEPAFKWFKVTDSALIPVENTDNTLITSQAVNTSLTIVNVTEDFLGKYLLTIGNERGDWNQSYFVEAYSSPVPPANFKASIIHGVLVFSWESSFNGGLEQSFVIQTSQEGTDLWSNQTFIHESDAAYMTSSGHYVDLVTDLPNGVYRCRLIAVNSVGNAEAVYLTSPLEMNRNDPSIDGKVNVAGDKSTLITGVVLGIVVIGLAVCVVLLILKQRRTSGAESKSADTRSRMNLPVYANVEYNNESTEQEVPPSRYIRGNEAIHGAGALLGVGEYSSLDQRLKDDSSAYDVINTRQNT